MRSQQDGAVPGPPSAWSESLSHFGAWALLLKAAREEMEVEGFGGRFQANETHPHQLLTLGSCRLLGTGKSSESHGSGRQIAQTINKWENSSESRD